eukprot:43156-Prymnesium_polylepis.1
MASTLFRAEVGLAEVGPRRRSHARHPLAEMIGDRGSTGPLNLSLVHKFASSGDISGSVLQGRMLGPGTGVRKHGLNEIALYGAYKEYASGSRHPRLKKHKLAILTGEDAYLMREALYSLSDMRRAGYTDAKTHAVHMIGQHPVRARRMYLAVEAAEYSRNKVPGAVTPTSTAPEAIGKTVTQSILDAMGRTRDVVRYGISLLGARARPLYAGTCPKLNGAIDELMLPPMLNVVINYLLNDFFRSYGNLF